MFIHRMFIVLFAALCMLQLSGQEDSNYVSPEMKRLSDDPNVNLRTGRYFYEFEKYSLAKRAFLQAYKGLPNNAELNYKLGMCYIETYPKRFALQYFKNAYQINPEISYDILYLLGRGYQVSYEFDEAIKLYERFRSSLSGRDIENWQSIINRRIEECNYAKEVILKPILVDIMNLGRAINSEYPDYRPLVSANDSILMFTSRRSTTTGRQKDPSDYQYYEDIYFSVNKDFNWQSARNIGTDLNTISHDAVVGLSADGNKLIYYDGSKNAGDLFISEKKGTGWSTPKPLPEKINTIFNESSAAFSRTCDTLYYVSNKPDGSFGGKDIYMTVLGKDGEWSDPKNLGPVINTKWDEDGVSIAPDGRTMYFSSQGHQSMGGYDIFRSIQNRNGNWLLPENVGYPINTPDDDIFFVISRQGKYAYYSSAKDDSFGEQDIYKITILDAKDLVVQAAVDTIMTDTGFIGEYITSLDGDVRATPLLMVQAQVQGIDTTLADIELASAQITDDMVIQDKVETIDNMPVNPIDVVIEVIDIAQDDEVSSYLPTSNTNRFDFILPPGNDFDVSVDIEHLFTRYGKALLISSDQFEQLLSSELEGDTALMKNILLNQDTYAEVPKPPVVSHATTANAVRSGKTKQGSDAFIASPATNNKYTVQIKALRYPVDIDNYFRNLKGVKEYYCNDGLYRYVVKEIDGHKNAHAERLKIIEKGYRDAFVLSMDNLLSKVTDKPDASTESDNILTIQIAASRKQLGADYFKGIENIKEFRLKNDLYIYTIGVYKNIEEARRMVTTLILQGYPGAFIIPVKELK